MSLVRITTPSPFSAHPQTGFGTRVWHEGLELRGIRAINVRIAPSEVIAADIELMCSFDGTATAVFLLWHPVTGKQQAVKRIEFEDGSVWGAADGGGGGCKNGQ